MGQKSISVIGIGDNGCLGLSSRSYNQVVQSQVLAGGRRQLEFFPDFPGEKIVLEKGIVKKIDEIVQISRENNVAVLASGDPLFFGIGHLIAKKAGKEHVDILPQTSSMQEAFARVGIKWDDAFLTSAHGRSLEGFVTRISTQSKVGCFTDGENSPQRIACRLLEYGETHWTAHVCENLGGANERVRKFSISELAEKPLAEISDLNYLILIRTEKLSKSPVIPYSDEEAFAKRMPKKGLITKKEIRALSLAKMRIERQSIVWDVGAGSGSVSIEAAKLATGGYVYAIECDPEGVDICSQNVLSHKVDNVRIVAGKAPTAFAGLDDPDAVFIGGSKGNMAAIIETAYEKLRPNGMMVINAVTLDNVVETKKALNTLEIEFDLCLVNISRGVPLAKKYTKYEALNPIHMFSVEKVLKK